DQYKGISTNFTRLLSDKALPKMPALKNKLISVLDPINKFVLYFLYSSYIINHCFLIIIQATGTHIQINHTNNNIGLLINFFIINNKKIKSITNIIKYQNLLLYILFFLLM